MRIAFRCKLCGDVFNTSRPQNVTEPVCNACRNIGARMALEHVERRKLRELGTMGQRTPEGR